MVPKEFCLTLVLEGAGESSGGLENCILKYVVIMGESGKMGQMGWLKVARVLSWSFCNNHNSEIT